MPIIGFGLKTIGGSVGSVRVIKLLMAKMSKSLTLGIFPRRIMYMSGKTNVKFKNTARLGASGRKYALELTKLMVPEGR